MKNSSSPSSSDVLSNLQAHAVTKQTDQSHRFQNEMEIYKQLKERIG